jgi:hypothetical protein
MTKTPLPEILRGVRGTCEVRFHYEADDGTSLYVSGHFEALAGTSRENVTGIKVRLGGASSFPGRAGDIVRFDLARIKADPETGLIIPVSKKELASGTGAASRIAPSGRQVAYALSLCNRDGDLGGGNFYRPAEAEFRAMSRAEVSAWIDTARSELGI